MKRIFSSLRNPNNGTSTDVYHFNPASNANQISYLRISNTSGISGRVTVSGWNDAGVRAPGTANFVLGAGQSVLLTSAEVENGNAAKLAGAFGDGVGKWRLEITGEFPGMRVQSLNRNYTDGTVTNLTDADGHGEQAWEKLWD